MAMASSQRNGEDAQLIPLLVLVACVVVGGYAVSEARTYAETPYVPAVLLLFSVGGLAYVVWGFNDVRKDSGTHAAMEWLLNGFDDTADSSDESTPEKTPPPPQKLKDEIRIDRADGRCELCSDQSNFLEIHHIKPRAKGGPNTRKNLMALCPNCHKEADSNVHSQSKLKHIIRNKED